MSPLSILSHNILQCNLGESSDEGPIVQTSTLAEIGQIAHFNFFLAKFWQIVNNGNLPGPPSNILRDLSAEWRTVLPILAHFAYSPSRPFSPSSFAAGIISPNIWLGQSYYRIRRLMNADIPKSDIISSILLVAHNEAAAVNIALSLATDGLTEPIILNSTEFDRESTEMAHETI